MEEIEKYLIEQIKICGNDMTMESEKHAFKSVLQKVKENKMDKVITDNSKVNINLLEENELLKEQLKKTKKYLENRLKLLDYELGYFEDDDDGNNTISARLTKQEIDEVNNLLISFDLKLLVFQNNRLDLLNWAKSELKQEINPKLGKTMTPYRTDKIRFLNRIIDWLDV